MPRLRDVRFSLNKAAVEKAMAVNRENQDLKARVAELDRVASVVQRTLDKLREDNNERRTALEDSRAKVAELEARLSAPGHDRFAAEDGDGERDTFDTIKEAREFAEQAIVDWRAEADDEWSECVEGVTVWVAIERARESPCEKNYPDDKDSSDFVLKPIPIETKEGGA